MTEDNKTFSFYLSKGTHHVLCCIACHVFVNRVCLHALFRIVYVICVMSVLKALQSLCCMLLHVPIINKTF